MGVSVKTERFGIARQWNTRIIDVRVLWHTIYQSYEQMLRQLTHQVCYDTLTHKYYERLYDRFLNYAWSSQQKNSNRNWSTLQNSIISSWILLLLRYIASKNKRNCNLLNSQRKQRNSLKQVLLITLSNLPFIVGVKATFTAIHFPLNFFSLVV